MLFIKFPKKSIRFHRKLRLRCHQYCFAEYSNQPVRMHFLQELFENPVNCSELNEIYPEGFTLLKALLALRTLKGFRSIITEPCPTLGHLLQVEILHFLKCSGV